VDFGTKLVVITGTIYTATVLVKSLNGFLGAVCSLIKKSRTLGKEVTTLLKKISICSTWKILNGFFKKIVSVEQWGTILKKILPANLSYHLKKSSDVAATLPDYGVDAFMGLPKKADGCMTLPGYENLRLLCFQCKA
jgi:hypothetical protein